MFKLKDKVKFKYVKNNDWLSRKKVGVITIKWSSVCRVLWNDNTYTETQLNLLERVEYINEV